MSTSAPFLVSSLGSRSQRGRLVRAPEPLSGLSVGWMTIEAAVAIVAAVITGSVALLGFGLIP